MIEAPSKDGKVAEETSSVSTFQKISITGAYLPQSLIFFWGGTISFCICTFLICSSVEGDAELTAFVESSVSSEAYSFPFCCFMTALSLNILTLIFERESIKFQLVLLTCYINMLAAVSDYLHWKGLAPITRDPWGHPFLLVRATMWLHTTPVMVLLLSMISDFSRSQTLVAVVADLAMLFSGIMLFMVTSVTSAYILLAISCVLFVYVIYAMWMMYSSVISESSDSKRRSLEITRLIMLGTWFTFPVIFLLARMHLVNLMTAEYVTSFGDILGKVMFSSSLLLGNFMTLEQRRLMTMHAVEESNRVSVIQELRDLLDQKELFLSSMSHELRTPLNGIIGLSDALLVGSCGEITDGVTKTITTMKVSGARLLNLINDILDAASMKRGALIVKQEKVNLFNVAQDVVELCQPLAKRGVVLLNSLSSHAPAVLGDTGRIIQILHNLIGNSCKFTHKGSISISAQRQGNVMAVAVSDTGIGIPEDKHTAIFEAFEQVDAATTRTYGGTGLGLNLVKSLVDSHGGTVAVKSKVGSGTTFIFTLKIWSKSMQDNGAAFLAEMAALGASSKVSSSGASDETHKEMHKEVMKQGRRLPFKTSSFTGLFKKEETSHPKPSRSKLSRSAEPNPSHAEADLFPIEPAIPKAVLNWAVTKRLKKSGDKARVLSVDDDPINQMVIQSLLTPEGYEVTQAMDGEEALDVLNKGELLPDIVLLDVMMPGMSGYQVCAKIRELYPASCLPVIMISAKSKEENIVEGLTKGANDYVVKPFGRQEILARVKAHLTFRDIVFMAGERAAEEQLELAMAPDVTLVSKVRTLLQVSGTKSTLPACMKRQLENGSGKQAHHELFNQLTMVVANFSNLTYLTEFVGADSVMLALTELYAKVQDLLDEHDCYLADTLEGNLVIVTGLDREANYAQVVEAINFAVDLLEVASSLTMVDGTTPFKLEIAIGIHTAAAQGVVVGVVHPVMYFTGNLPDVATYLQITSPENCIHVSRSVYKQYASPVNFVEVPGPPSRGQKEETYMYKAGSWREGMTRVADKCARFSLEHPFDTINLNATRMKPIQMSLLTLVQCDPGLLLELTVSGTTNPAIKAATSSLPRMSMNGSMSGMLSNRESRDAVEKKLLHEKEMVEEQLNEVSEEASRLQDKVDSLEAEMAVKAAEMAAKADKSVASDAELAILKAQVAVLETSKQAVDNGDAHAKALQERVEELTAQLEELQEVYSHAFKLEEQTKQMEKHNADLELQLSIALTRQNQLQNQLSEDRRVGPSNTSSSQSLYNTHQAPSRNLSASPIHNMHLPPGKRSSSLMITGEQAISQSPALSSASHSDLEQLENSLVSHFVKPHGANTVEDPSMTDMALVLEDLGLDYLTPRFKIEEINLNILPYLDDKMLRSLGAVSVGSRLKLRLAARVLGGHHEAP